jgi:hypothetical protein
MAAMPPYASRPWTRDRFYTIAGYQLPSVTTILDVIAKPALGPWYAKQERRYFETAMLEVLSKPGARDPEYVLSAVVDAVGGVKAADREKQRAATIGTAIHAGIEWQLRTHLGEDAGPEPVLPDAAAWAVESWKGLGEEHYPRALGHRAHRLLRGVRLCRHAGSLRTGRRHPDGPGLEERSSDLPEAFLQNVAYRHAAERQGLPSTQGLIVRVPKLIDDPSWEVMVVPQARVIDDFLAAARLWRWQRQMEGKPIGDLRVGRPCCEQEWSPRLATAMP